MKRIVNLAARLPRLAVLAGCFLLGGTFPAGAFAADGTFQTAANPGGGTILSGTLGNVSLPHATATLLRRVHAELGTRPTVVQSAEDARDHSVALLFTATHRGVPCTGVALVTASPGAQAAGSALYDASSRFPTSLRAMLRQLQARTAPQPPHASRRVALAPAEALVAHPFSDGTGSISVPAGWTVRVAAGGSAAASAPGNAAQVSYNMHFSGLDPSNPRAQMFLRTASPLARAGFNGIVAPYTGDPVQAWKAMYEGLGRQHGFDPHITITSSSRVGASGASIAGTLGTGPTASQFIGFVFVLPPNPMGMWTLSDSHLFVTQSQIAKEANTANAVLGSVRINFGAVAAQQQQVRAMFQKQFEAEIARDRQQDAARYQRTQQFLASDRAAQEGMHRQAVAMENYSLDRAVIVNTTTGRHHTVDASFASTLVQANPKYQEVPASGLLRGIDY